MRAESENMMPAASIVDDQAIELVTWHASKGREWPIVAVCGMSQAVKASLPDLRLGYSSFDDLDSLIESANIEYSPSLDSKDAGKRFVDLLQPDREDQVMREIYVAISRPRDQLLLEWPLSAVESESTSRASLLEGKAKLTLNEDSINVAGGEAFPAIVERPAADGEVQTEGVTNSLLLPKHGLRAIKQCQYTGALTPDSRAPSSRHEEVSEEVSVQWEAIQYAEPLVLPEHADYLAVGDFVHRVFELGTENEQAAAYLRSKAEALWPEQAEEVLSLASASKVSFDAMLVATYQPTDTSVEVPIIGLDTNNTVVNGVVDMLVKGPEGTLIIDHKTDRERDLGVVFQRHIRQLSDYADLLSKQGNTEVAVNAVMSGVLLSAKVDGKRRITD
jgi:ATP-dependent exoDNAse (exonuclease V) beta subunit